MLLIQYFVNIQFPEKSSNDNKKTTNFDIRLQSMVAEAALFILN